MRSLSLSGTPRAILQKRHSLEIWNSLKNKTMQCSKAKPLIPLYIENEVGILQKRFIKAHLRHCEACKGLYADTKKILTVLGKCAPVELPGVVKQQIIKKLSEDRRIKQ